MAGKWHRMSVASGLWSLATGFWSSVSGGIKLKGIGFQEFGSWNAEGGNKERHRMPAIVTLWSDYGIAGRTHAPTYKNQTFNLFQFHIPHSQFRIQIPWSLALNINVIVITLLYKNCEVELW